MGDFPIQMGEWRHYNCRIQCPCHHHHHQEEEEEEEEEEEGEEGEDGNLFVK